MTEGMPTATAAIEGIVQELLEKMPVGVVVNTLDGPTWMNAAAAAAAGYDDPAELRHRSFADLVHPDDLARTRERAAHMLESGEAAEPALFRIAHRNGGWVEMEIVPVAVVELAGRRANLLVVQNVTARRAVEEALRTTESRYRAIFDATAIGIALLDADGWAVAANPALRQLLGWEGFEPGTVRPRDLVHPDDRELVMEHARRLRNGSLERFDSELRVRRSDGSWAWAHAHISAVRGGIEATFFTVILLEDITERKQLEEQLRLSQRLESIGRLAGGVAHDFNNLITVITGHSDLLLASMGNEDRLRQDVEEIRQAADRAASLTRQLLAFSRRQVLQPRVLRPNEVVEGMKGMLERIIGEDVEVSFQLSSGVGLVRADPGQIEQVILNLVVNARDAMPKGGQIRISTHERVFDRAFVQSHPGSSQGPHVGVAIADTGHGMTEDVMARIFEPFFTTKEPGKGTGLGLAMSYGIVKQSGGYILVESEAWRGSTFTIYLPCCEDAEDVPRIEAAPTLTTGSETVLIVEDEAMVRQLARRILERFGYSVLDADGAGAALRLAMGHEGPIHLLLTDVVMPKVGGLELAERLQDLRPETRVLFMSGYTDDAMGRRGLFDPRVPFLQKPFTPDGLGRKVREVLDARE